MSHFTPRQLDFLQELNRSEGGQHYVLFDGMRPGSPNLTLRYGINDKQHVGVIQIHSPEAAADAIQRLRELTGQVPTYIIPERGSRERDRHLKLCAEQAIRYIYTWTMPADYGLNMGMPERNAQPGDATWRPVGTSADEILQAIIEFEPRPDFDAGEDYPEEVRQYARELWEDTGAYIRNHANMDPFDVMEKAAHCMVTIIHLYGFTGVQRGIRGEVWDALAALDHDLYVTAQEDPAEAWRLSALKIGLEVEDG